MKQVWRKLLPVCSGMVFSMALSIIGKSCRFFLYQPRVPLALRDPE